MSQTQVKVLNLINKEGLDQTRAADAIVLEEIKRFFAGKIFRTPIPRSVKISEAPSHGLAITDYDRNGKGAAAFAAVTKELIDRCEV